MKEIKLAIIFVYFAFSTLALDPYATLGLSHSANKEYIREAFKYLSVKYHPDRNPKNKEIYGRIVNAYEILKDNDFDLTRIDDSVPRPNQYYSHKGGKAQFDYFFSRMEWDFMNVDLNQYESSYSQSTFLYWFKANPKIIFAATLISIGVYLLFI